MLYRLGLKRNLVSLSLVFVKEHRDRLNLFKFIQID